MHEIVTLESLFYEALHDEENRLSPKHEKPWYEDI